MRAHEPGVRRNSFEPCVACWGAGVSRGRAGQFLGGTLPRWDSEATGASAHAVGTAGSSSRAGGCLG